MPRSRCLILGVVFFTVLLPAIAVRGDEPVPERMLHKQVEIDAPITEVWHAWTTVEGLRFVSPESRVELRVGGPYEWFLQLEPDEQGKRGGEGARVLSYVPGEMLSFTWTFPPSIPTLRYAGETTHVVVRLEETGGGATRVDFVQLGWGEGEAWDSGYDYFDKAWDYVLDRLKQSLESEG